MCTNKLRLKLWYFCDPGKKVGCFYCGLGDNWLIAINFFQHFKRCSPRTLRYSCVVSKRQQILVNFLAPVGPPFSKLKKLTRVFFEDFFFFHGKLPYTQVYVLSYHALGQRSQRRFDGSLMKICTELPMEGKLLSGNAINQCSIQFLDTKTKNKTEYKNVNWNSTVPCKSWDLGKSAYIHLPGT